MPQPLFEIGASPTRLEDDRLVDAADAEIERAFYGDISPAEAAALATERTEEYFLIASFAAGARE